MHTINDVHQQFAEYFNDKTLRPFAYLLSKKISEGHICLPLDDFDQEKALLPEHYKPAELDLKKLASVPLLSFDLNEKKPFVIHQHKLYLQRYLHYETLILDRIHRFLEKEKQQFGQRIQQLKTQQSLIQALFEKKPSGTNTTPLPDWQLAAAITGVLNNFSVITGGPGTGKTTTVAKILALIFANDINTKVALAAPTGKAAARMAQSLKEASLNADKSITDKFQSLIPSTLHRLLKSTYHSGRFAHNKDNPLNYDVVIIDESSMIDVSLFAGLMDAIGPDTRLILLGDKNQLASVEAGSLFGDLCSAMDSLNVFSAERAELINHFITEKQNRLPDECIKSATGHPLFEHIVELKKSFRFNDDEGIGKFSKAIIQNNEQSLHDFMNHNDVQVTLDTDYNEQLLNDFVIGYRAFILEPDISKALEKFNALRVLCAVKEGPQGVFAINKKIEELLIKEKLIHKTGEFYVNRPVMVTGNNYELRLFNGDIGIIRKNDSGTSMAYFEDNEGKLNPVLPGYINRAETVYAMTIHKSQGSEFEKVMMILPQNEHNRILTRELIYTGITRAKEKIFIQSTKEVILTSASRNVGRASGVIDRLSHQQKNN